MRNNVAVIDFGTSKIVTLVAETSGKQRCDIKGAGNIAYDGFSGGGWNTPSKLTEAIRSSVGEACKQAHANIRTAYVGVPGEFSRVYPVTVSMTLQGTDPRVTMANINDLLNQAQSELGDVRGEIIHRSPAWFVVDGGKKTLEPLGMKGRELRGMVSFVVADQCFRSEITPRLQECQIGISGIFSTPTGEAMLYLPGEERDRTAILIDVGYLNTDVMAVEGDALTFLKTLPIGGAHIALDVVDGLRVPMNDAEKIKREYSFGIAAASNTTPVRLESDPSRVFSHEEISEVLEPRVDEIADMIKKCLALSGVEIGSWCNIYLTGGGLAQNRGGRDYLAGKLEKPVRDLPKKAVKLNSAIYSSALGTLDLVVDTIMRNRMPSGGLFGGVKDFFSNLMGG